MTPGMYSFAFQLERSMLMFCKGGLCVDPVLIFRLKPPVDAVLEIHLQLKCAIKERIRAGSKSKTVIAPQYAIKFRRYFGKLVHTIGICGVRVVSSSSRSAQLNKVLECVSSRRPLPPVMLYTIYFCQSRCNFIVGAVR